MNVSVTKSCLDWENVQISNIPSEVQGLKGMSSWSSLSKLQDRAYDKIKIETAMLGGNVAYIIEQNTEEAVSGGQYGGSKAPSVTISGLAYTTKKVFKNEISFGDYQISKIYVLKTNAYTLEEVSFKEQDIQIQEGNLIEENRFQKINLNISSLSNIEEFTFIYADKNEIVLSGVHTTRRGKTTYYNVVLTRK